MVMMVNAVMNGLRNKFRCGFGFVLIASIKGSALIKSVVLVRTMKVHYFQSRNELLYTCHKNSFYVKMKCKSSKVLDH